MKRYIILIAILVLIQAQATDNNDYLKAATRTLCVEL